MAQYAFAYGNADDEVYFGNFVVEATGPRVDEALVRRGNAFILRGKEGEIAIFGDKGDEVLVGDWNDDGKDSLAVRRGNHYFVKNDITTGYSDSDFFYGDPSDKVIVGDWDGDGLDTLTVRRGNQYLVANQNANVYSEYDFRYGEANDTVLAGDWATAPTYVKDDPRTTNLDESKHYLQKDDNLNTQNVDESKVTVGLGLKLDTPGVDADGKDQLAIKRGNQYFLSQELVVAKPLTANAVKLNPVSTTSFFYGNPTDTAFVAAHGYKYDDNRGVDFGVSPKAQLEILVGDGIGVRRVLG
jgi:hypothetical protein